jgi:ABC-type nickel/cobalt efflux system permease component RcnA
MSAAQLPLWAQYIQAAAIAVIAGTGAWIAWKQMRIARTKLQLDLYDKRASVFEAARKFLGHVGAKGTATDEAIREYSLAIANAPFLFDDGMAKYLDEVLKRAIHLQTFKQALDMPGGAEQQRREYSNEATKQMMWLVAQVDELTGKFKPWLALEQRRSRWGAWFWR